MRVLYAVFEAKLGGHVLSAFTVASEMKSRGHDVVFLGKPGRLTSRIEQQMPFVALEIPIFNGSRQTYFTRRSWSAVARLRRVIRERQIDLVHAFDAGTYMHCYLASMLEKIPVICTVCGGIDPYYDLPRCRPLIVFSEEQRRKMVSRWRWLPEQVEIIRNRLDLGYIGDRSRRLSEAELASFGIRCDLPLIVMITSFRGLQINGIYRLIQSLRIARRSHPFRMVFIGGENEDVERHADDINAEHGKGTVLFLKPIEDAFRFLEHATVVMGVGRCAFEGMAYGKPTIVIGDKGFAGVVDAETVEQLAFYNFSGRNQKEPHSPEILAHLLCGLLDDEELRCRIGTFGRRYVMEEFDVRVGAARIEAIYDAMLAEPHPSLTTTKLIKFARLLMPIFYDNLMHYPKTVAKKVLNRVSAGKLYPVPVRPESC